MKITRRLITLGFCLLQLSVISHPAASSEWVEIEVRAIIEPTNSEAFLSKPDFGVGGQGETLLYEENFPVCAGFPPNRVMGHMLDSSGQLVGSPVEISDPVGGWRPVMSSAGNAVYLTPFLVLDSDGNCIQAGMDVMARTTFLGGNFKISTYPIGAETEAWGTPRIHNNDVVWSDWNGRIWHVDLATLSPAEVIFPGEHSFPSSSGISVDIGDRLIVWTRPVDGSVERQLMGFDRVENVIFPIQLGRWVHWRRTSGAWAVWVESEDWGGPPYYLRAYNRDTGMIHEISSTAGDFAVDGDVVVYRQQGNLNLFVHRLSDATSYEVSLSEPALFIDIQGDKLAWSVTESFISTNKIVVAAFRFVSCDNEGGDADGDRVCQLVDSCPTEDATGFDANLDGCIDSIDGISDFLNTLVDETVIDATLRDQLLSRMATASATLDRDNICAAVNQFEALKNQITALAGKKISGEAADQVIAYIDNVITLQLAALPPGSICP